MPIIEIHGTKFRIPEGSNSAKFAAEYLEKYKENMKDITDAAKHDRINGVTHFQTHKPAGYHGATEFTVVHNKNHDGGYEFELRKKGHHFM